MNIFYWFCSMSIMTQRNWGVRWLIGSKIFSPWEWWHIEKGESGGCFWSLVLIVYHITVTYSSDSGRNHDKCLCCRISWPNSCTLYFAIERSLPVVLLTAYWVRLSSSAPCQDRALSQVAEVAFTNSADPTTSSSAFKRFCNLWYSFGQ